MARERERDHVPDGFVFQLPTPFFSFFLFLAGIVVDDQIKIEHFLTAIYFSLLPTTCKCDTGLDERIELKHF